MTRELLTMSQVCARVQASRSSVYVWMETKDFPRPLKLGGSCNRWISVEVDAWLSAQPRAVIQGR